MMIKRLACVGILVVLATPALGADKKEASAVPKAKTETSAIQTASVSEQDPHAVVRAVTADLLDIVDRGKDTLSTDPNPYFAEVRGVLERTVDFKFIARAVMGGKHWKAATPAQRQRFIEVFTAGLVETYARGMANFSDFEVTVLDPEKPLKDARKATVKQRFVGPKGKNIVAYTMRKSREGWRLANVVIDGVNFGSVLRAQFSQAVADQKGDLDAVIEGWVLKT